MLRTRHCWKKLKLVAKTGNFQEFLKLELDYDHVMSFLIIARKYKQSKNPYYAKAIAVSLDWLDKSKKAIPLELAIDFQDFFSTFVADEEVQSEQDLGSLFRLCR